MKYLYGTAVMAACLAAAAGDGVEESSDSSHLMKTALEFVARASSSSEVLTLNLTNLAILIGIKILFFAFAIFGFAVTQGGQGGSTGYGSGGGGYGGGGSSGGYGRSASEDSLTSIKKSELTGGMCFIMYASGETDKMSCVQRSACEDPKTAANYLQAAKFWHKMHKLVKAVPFNNSYESIMNSVEEASNHSEQGGDCSKYKVVISPAASIKTLPHVI